MSKDTAGGGLCEVSPIVLTMMTTHLLSVAPRGVGAGVQADRSGAS